VLLHVHSTTSRARRLTAAVRGSSSAKEVRFPCDARHGEMKGPAGWFPAAAPGDWFGQPAQIERPRHRLRIHRFTWKAGVMGGMDGIIISCEAAIRRRRYHAGNGAPSNLRTGVSRQGRTPLQECCFFGHQASRCWIRSGVRAPAEEARHQAFPVAAAPAASAGHRPGVKQREHGR